MISGQILALRRADLGAWLELANATLAAVAVLVAVITWALSRRDARFAQARLVYSLHEVLRLEEGDWAEVFEGSAVPGLLMEFDERHGYRLSTACVVVVVAVFNDSQEVISNVDVRVSTGEVVGFREHDYTLASLPPGGVRLVGFVEGDAWANVVSGLAHEPAPGQLLEVDIRLTYTDSAGRNWRRVNAQPIKKQFRNPHFHTLVRDDLIGVEYGRNGRRRLRGWPHDALTVTIRRITLGVRPPTGRTP